MVEIDGLAEFDDGPNAGWMYNGQRVFPGIGIGSCAVHDGDEIVFHYSHDYTRRTIPGATALPQRRWGRPRPDRAPRPAAGAQVFLSERRSRISKAGFLAGKARS